MINQNEIDHGLRYGNRPRAKTRVVSSFYRSSLFLSFLIHCVLHLGYGRVGFMAILTTRSAPLVIPPRSPPRVLVLKPRVPSSFLYIGRLPANFFLNYPETHTHLKAPYSPYAQKRPGKIRIKLVKNGFARDPKEAPGTQPQRFLPRNLPVFSQIL